TPVTSHENMVFQSVPGFGISGGLSIVDRPGPALDYCEWPRRSGVAEPGFRASREAKLFLESLGRPPARGSYSGYPAGGCFHTCSHRLRLLFVRPGLCVRHRRLPRLLGPIPNCADAATGGKHAATMTSEAFPGK